MIHVTSTAIARYRQWVASEPDDVIRARLCTRAFERAADFGATIVRLGTGHRCILRGRSVVTVLPRDRRRRRSLAPRTMTAFNFATAPTSEICNEIAV